MIDDADDLTHVFSHVWVHLFRLSVIHQATVLIIINFLLRELEIRHGFDDESRKFLL